MRVQKLRFNRLQVFVLSLLVLGVFWRCFNLDHKVYWGDETFTSFRIAGYTETEIIQQAFNGQVITVDELQKYQQVTPEKDLGDTLRSLSLKDSQLPPLYFVLVRFWVQLFGNSVTVTRSLSVVFSLLVFPAFYWLCRELFASPKVAWITLALAAVSPFQVLYGQEARPYSLLMVTTLLSSAALLRALRLKTTLSWGLYAITMALGFYTFLLSALVAIGHGIYVLICEGLRLSKTTIAYLLASLTSGVLFAPWLWVVISSLSTINQTTSWKSREMTLLPLLSMWARNISYDFFDVQLGYNDPVPYLIPPLVILVIYSFYFVWRRAPKQALFITTLTASTALPPVWSDLMTGGVMSTAARYFIPSYLGIKLAVAYLLATQLTNSSKQPNAQQRWRLALATLSLIGVISCAVMSEAETWWNRYQSYYIPQVAREINKAEQPLVVADGLSNQGNIMALGYRLDPKVRLQLVVAPEIPKIPDGFSDVFLFKPNQQFREQIERENRRHGELVFAAKTTRLWRLDKQS
ncbi:glycosyltransferase family 39 protein [Leptolyngbya sp. FACHB-261]|uniref:glycosyltransferase family 39 protein n=1 Tax=Leptolyngbya sp. FACHB-261 TaxID=2692806 RepID=UPI0016864833|nr:glycosyltransferase family 39 protein [Leptolyngbya sp. FACHB-261]MBD2103620.1 glycosyltransferase family 39 protein [Leptolyngbya sp. FACHB-261]